MGNHRADRRTSAPTRSVTPAQGGRRKATRRAATPKHPLTGLPILPTVAGSVAVAVAAGGAMSDQAVASSDVSTAKLNRLSAVALAPALGDRAMAISRDSDRIAEEDAAQAELKDQVTEDAAARTATLEQLALSAGRQARKLKLNQWFLPVAPVDYHLTARFGSGGGLWAHGHTGLDFAGDTGSDIMAVANGTITEVGWAGAYGNRTIETLEDGTEIWYCHQTSTLVNVGDVVHGGEHIGELGSTGNTTGPHLHLEVRPGGGNPIDPFTALVYHGLHP